MNKIEPLLPRRVNKQAARVAALAPIGSDGVLAGGRCKSIACQKIIHGRSLSIGGNATVHIQHLAGHKIGSGRGEKQSRTDHIGGLGKAAEGNA